MKRTLKNEKIKLEVLETLSKLVKSGFQKKLQRFVGLNNSFAMRLRRDGRVTRTKMRTRLRNKTKSNSLSIWLTSSRTWRIVVSLSLENMRTPSNNRRKAWTTSWHILKRSKRISTNILNVNDVTTSCIGWGKTFGKKSTTWPKFSRREARLSR